MAIRDEGSTPTPPDKGTPKPPDKRSPTAEDLTLLSFVFNHPTLLVSIVAALIFAVRCVVVSRGDPYVASILLTQTSLGDAIRVLLFELGPIFFTVGGVSAAVIAEERKEWSTKQALGVIVAGAIVTAIAFYVDGTLLSWTSLAYLLFFGLLAGSSVRKRRAGPGGEPGTRSLLIFATVLTLLFGWAFMASEDFWLPKELLIFQSEAPFTGYVLRSRDDYLVIMKDRPRVIVERPKAALTDRDFCYTDRPFHPAPKRLHTNLPPCR